MKKTKVLCILDGWGLAPDREDNAISRASTPNFTRFLNTYPHTQLITSGPAVGLPEGQMGNSEVGHMTIGGGRTIEQELTRINKAIYNNKLKDIKALEEYIIQVKKANGRIHLLGLVSDGGVHSHINHMIELARIAQEFGVEVLVHCITDGRDTPPQSAMEYLGTLQRALPHTARIVSVMGRFYAMDRDNKWDRTEEAYRIIAEGTTIRSKSTINTMIEDSYSDGVYDEFFAPTAIGDYGTVARLGIFEGFIGDEASEHRSLLSVNKERSRESTPKSPKSTVLQQSHYGGIADNDGLIITNFRADRIRQITESLLDENFTRFSRDRHFTKALGVSNYFDIEKSNLGVLFPTTPITNTLGEILAKAGKKQFRIAETEKYAHVTFFFNAGKEKPFAGEERMLIPSPKVKTYDMSPAMSALEITEHLVQAISDNKYDLIIVNYANPDMVGHCGLMAPAIAAVEVMDQCLGQLEAAVLKVDGSLVITADHGNIEQMLDEKSGQPMTSHTTNPVPFILVQAKTERLRDSGTLADVAPTILFLMDMEIPTEMTGKSLLIK